MSPRIGAWTTNDGAHFRVWAPDHARVEYVLYAGGPAPLRLEARPEERGYFGLHAAGVRAGALYAISLDGAPALPDPASRSQPEGVHGPSCVIADDYAWTDAAWTGTPLASLVIEEVHVGTATPRGTFEALIDRLDHYLTLGVSALELMPVAAFPGARGWGYDGVCLFAPHEVYGGPRGLCRLVDAAHARGLAVLLDVVYNHLGPDGNYLRRYATDYFTDRHATPWGEAISFDGARSDEVRAFFLENARMWIEDYHLDGLRLDATQTIFDRREPTILQQIAERARLAAPGRVVCVIAEDDRNCARLLRRTSARGAGLDAVWADDLHHSLARGLVGDRGGYYRDYEGTIEELAAILRRGWLYEGQWSTHHGGPRGSSAEGIPPERFVHFIQNHDQIGNRSVGDRLSTRVDDATYRAMSALLLLSPFTPLLFMGQEWAAPEPFLYFTDHEPALGRLVSEGRRREFADFEAFSGSTIPDPQATTTFDASKLDWSALSAPRGQQMLAWYRALLALRRAHPALREPRRRRYTVTTLGVDALRLDYGDEQAGDRRLQVICAFGSDSTHQVHCPPGLVVTLWSQDPRYAGAERTLKWRSGAAHLEVRGPAALVLAGASYSAAIASSEMT